MSNTTWEQKREEVEGEQYPVVAAAMLGEPRPIERAECRCDPGNQVGIPLRQSSGAEN
ncbi:MAG TPA: hypothetical protein VF614_13815 [Chthoniobacteraceae bacterium]